MSQKYVEIWEASKSSRNVLNIGICWQLKVYTWIFLIGFGYLGVLNTVTKFLEIAQSMYIVNSDKKNNDVIDDIPEHLHKSVLQISKESLQSFVKKKS